jgi:hypothetical protein
MYGLHVSPSAAAAALHANDCLLDTAANCCCWGCWGANTAGRAQNTQNSTQKVKMYTVESLLPVQHTAGGPRGGQLQGVAAAHVVS